MYIDQLIAAWPRLTVKWSLDPQKWHLAFDGDVPDWAKNLRLGRAQLAEIHKHLCFNSKICSVEELRDGGAADKVEKVINHWQQGDALTPPALCIINERNVDKILIAGGNHRFNVAYLTGEITIYFLASCNDSAGLQNFMPSLVWIS
ncbi:MULTISPECIES: hypothetical protein [Serratia]|uniref:hypothetical protein n=1 Tax=Serratia TaxID=613 RepID=UPI00384F202E